MVFWFWKSKKTKRLKRFSSIKAEPYRPDDVPEPMVLGKTQSSELDNTFSDEDLVELPEEALWGDHDLDKFLDHLAMDPRDTDPHSTEAYYRRQSEKKQTEPAAEPEAVYNASAAGPTDPFKYLPPPVSETSPEPITPASSIEMPAPKPLSRSIRELRGFKSQHPETSELPEALRRQVRHLRGRLKLKELTQRIKTTRSSSPEASQDPALEGLIGTAPTQDLAKLSFQGFLDHILTRAESENIQPTATSVESMVHAITQTIPEPQTEKTTTLGLSDADFYGWNGSTENTPKASLEEIAFQDSEATQSSVVEAQLNPSPNVIDFLSSQLWSGAPEGIMLFDHPLSGTAPIQAPIQVLSWLETACEPKSPSKTAPSTAALPLGPLGLNADGFDSVFVSPSDVPSTANRASLKQRGSNTRHVLSDLLNPQPKRWNRTKTVLPLNSALMAPDDHAGQAVIIQPLPQPTDFPALQVELVDNPLLPGDLASRPELPGVVVGLEETETFWSFEPVSPRVIQWMKQHRPNQTLALDAELSTSSPPVSLSRPAIQIPLSITTPRSFSSVHLTQPLQPETAAAVGLFEIQAPTSENTQVFETACLSLEKSDELDLPGAVLVVSAIPHTTAPPALVSWRDALESLKSTTVESPVPQSTATPVEVPVDTDELALYADETETMEQDIEPYYQELLEKAWRLQHQPVEALTSQQERREMLTDTLLQIEQLDPPAPSGPIQTASQHWPEDIKALEVPVATVIETQTSPQPSLTTLQPSAAFPGETSPYPTMPDTAYPIVLDSHSGVTLLASRYLDHGITLLLVEYLGICSLMLDDTHHISVVKAFDKNPLLTSPCFEVDLSTKVGSKHLMSVRLGPWEGIISLENGKAWIQADFS